MTFELHGHRGARGLRPENTLAGFECALAIGVTALEIDVCLTRDDVLVAHHDYCLGPQLTRLDGHWIEDQPCLRELTLAQLRRYDVGRLNPAMSYGRDFPQQRAVDGAGVPTLAEVLAMALARGGPGLQFNIEAKSKADAPGITAAPDEIAARVVAEIEAAGIGPRCLVQSFDWRVVQAVQRLAPALTTGYTSCSQDWYDTVWRGRDVPSPWLAGRDVADFGGSLPALVSSLGGKAWMSWYGEVDAASLAEAHALGLRVMVWTVNEPADMRRLIEMGIDGITTDYPDRLREVAGGLGLPLPPPAP